MIPRFEHDCAQCILIGQTNEVDIYVHPHGDDGQGDGIVRRYGDHLSAYFSMRAPQYRSLAAVTDAPGIDRALAFYDEWRSVEA